MRKHKNQSIALVLATLSIALSLILWAGIVQSLMGTVLEVSGDSPPNASKIAAADSSSEGGRIAPPSLLTQPVQPLHFAASSSARSSDTENRSELSQWEIQEYALLSIPSLSIRSPVLLPSRRYWDAHDWETLERQMQVGLLYGAVSYPLAVDPGELGTIVIAGHSSPPDNRARESRFGSLFAILPQIGKGSRILLRTGSRSAEYVVTGTAVVPAGDTAILAQQKDESLLRLMTCYPVGSTKERFVVTAKLLGDE